MNDHTRHNPELPDDLRSLEASLDALGQRARSSAPGGLGDRIADEGARALTGVRPGELRLSGNKPEHHHRAGWTQHWRLAASVTLLIVAVVAAIALNPTAPVTGVVAIEGGQSDTASFDDDWIDFETEYVADTGWDDDAFDALSSELDELELSLGSAWTLDENLNLNEGESL